MNAKVSVFVICFEAIIYLLLYNLHDCTFKHFMESSNSLYQKMLILKLQYVVLQNNCLFAYDQFQKNLSQSFRPP